MPPKKRSTKKHQTGKPMAAATETDKEETDTNPGGNGASEQVKEEAKPEHIPVAIEEPEGGQDGDKGIEHVPVICVGASAGGLEAIERLFTGLDSEAGASYIIIMHLSPEHKSQLCSLIQRYTEKVVTEIRQDMPLERDHVYVIPPNRIVGLMNNKLQLLERPKASVNEPINFFLRALATDKQDMAIAIILSGTGSDGSTGIRAIKGEMGLVLAQDPETARFTGMPSAAIGTGLVDYVVPPEQMGDKLRSYLSRPKRSLLPLKPHLLDAPAQEGLNRIFFLLRNKTGHDFSQYKKTTVLRRIERRMKIHQADDLGMYVRLLQESPNELKTLFRELLIGVTAFFRDPDGFEVLRHDVLPAIIENKADDGDLRIWLPGVATGEEAYSMAICIQEALTEAQRHLRVQVFATDINEDAIDTARAGVYPASIEHDISPERLDTHFTKMESYYKVNREVREMVVFALQDLVRDPPFTKLDLICCRNLLIYLDADLQKKLLPLFHYSLTPRGFLFLGSSETVGEFTDLFENVNSKWKIFQRKQSSASPYASYGFPLRRSETHGRHRSTGGDSAPLPQLVERRLLEEFAPACVIINRSGNIFYIHGRTGKYLEPTPGEAAMNIFEMAREGLKVRLPGLVRKAAAQGMPIAYEGLRVRTNGDSECINVTVKPLDSVRDGEPLLMVYFEDAPEPLVKKRRAAEGKKSTAYVQELEEDLARTKENLQTTIEELQTSNEELKSMNEEYQSTNEELQSANEELETSREEMQSLNEELSTVNDELQDKIVSLTHSHEDMKLFLNSLNIPTLFLDNDLRIQRFTSQTARLINVLDQDVGRPLNHISNNLRGVDLMGIAHEVQATMQQLEKEVQDLEGQWHLMRVLPYRSTMQQMAGVVVTFVDIHELKRMQDELLAARAQRDYAGATLETVRDSIIVLDEELAILSISDPFCRLMQWPRREVIGKNFFQLLQEGSDLTDLRFAVQEALEREQKISDVTATVALRQGKRNQLTFYGRSIERDGENPTRVILIVSDLTARASGETESAGV